MIISAQEWYLEEYPPMYYSGYESEDFNCDAVEGFEDILTSFIATDVILYKGNPFVDTGIETRVVIQNVTSDSETNTYKRQLLSRIGQVECGDYIYHKLQNRYYIVVGLSDNNKMYEKSILYYCNYQLKFISSISGKIVIYPICDLNSTQYNSGVKENAQVRIGSAQHILYIPYNNETILVDHDRRFLIDKNTVKPTAYKLTQVDSVSGNYGNKGVLKWTVSEDNLNLQTDNVELMIADYSTKTESVENSQNNKLLNCEIIGTDYIKCGGNSRTFSVDFHTEELVGAVWNIENSVSDKLNYSIYKNKITISCDNPELIGTSFILSVLDSNGQYNATCKTIKVVDLYERDYN